jgi:tripartite-type tricarboxylate transporter receptor subunit TctC
VPAAVVTKIHTDTAKVLQIPEIREKLTGLGAEPAGSTPDQLKAAMRTEYDRYGKLIQKLGIKAD